MKLWITNATYPTPENVINEAIEAGAEQIFHGVPESFVNDIPPGSTGFIELPDPEPPVNVASELDPIEVLQAQVAELVAAIEALLGVTP